MVGHLIQEDGMVLFLRYKDGKNCMLSERKTRALIRAFKEDHAGPMITALVCAGCTLETMGGQHLEDPRTTWETLTLEANGNISGLRDAQEGGAA